MKIISLNIGQRKTIVYNGKEEQTGIYKNPVSTPVLLTSEGVAGDNVVDRRYHGGTDKACYAYGLGAYRYWKTIYPEVEMPFGMFGENLTIDGLDETKLYIGQTFHVGDATLQVSQPRIPGYKLGIRFGDKSIVKRFQQSDFSGVYFRVLEQGAVNVGDKLIEIKTAYPKNIMVAQVYQLFKGGKFDSSLAETALNEPFMSESIKNDIQIKLNKAK